KIRSMVGVGRPPAGRSGRFRRQPSMSLAAFCRELRFHWRAFAHSVWPETPRERAERERACLAAELRRRELGLLRRRCKVEQLRADLRRQEREVTRLSAGLQGSPGRAGAEAWDAALALDRLRQA